jgi:hypothetical protein
MKRRNPQQEGVALVITLILLAVITFMAVTFLVVSRHERERVTTQSSQTDANAAVAAALEQAKAMMISSMLARNNSHDLHLFVSTNYINPFGFNPANPVSPNITNVSYTYAGGGQVAGKDMIRLAANLQILPRVPVFVSTNQGSLPDFRFYHDLNRNGAYDTNGFGTNFLNYATGLMATNRDGTVQTNLLVGDPEWIGILANPEQPHSASNQFVARYAFFAVPIGNGLDLNYDHNQAKVAARGGGNPAQLSRTEGYLRDEGVGSWEMNLAAFLYYLNTNTYAWGYGPGSYRYDTNALNTSAGNAFFDSLGIVRWRANDTYANPSVLTAFYPFGNAAASAFAVDGIDEYSVGPLFNSIDLPGGPDPDRSITSRPWPGADNPQHFFTHQDLFVSDTSNPQIQSFTNHLFSVGLNLNNTFDRYTFYRLFDQAGFESAPEPPGKINLNYDNRSTNLASFNSWKPITFFTNAANSLLTNMVASDPNHVFPANLSIANIPIYPVNYYTPAVHRMLQLAANAYDSTTNRLFRASSTNVFPSVFRPTFGRVGTNVFINGYEEVPNLSSVNDPVWLAKPVSLPENLTQLSTSVATNRANVYGVPWVIGAKKGLPNFNQFGFETVSHITRRLEIDKRSPGNTNRASWYTNQMYVIGISNIIGLDAWNSYSAPYPRNVFITGNDDLRMSLTVTNNPGGILFATNLPVFTAPNSYFAPATNVAGGFWFGFNTNPAASTNQIAPSFQSYKSNVVFLPGNEYLIRSQQLIPTNQSLIWERLTGPMPHFVLSVTNRLRFVILDTATPGNIRVLDYVQFGGVDGGGMDGTRDLTAELPLNDPLGVWQTNTGVFNQLQASINPNFTSLAQWNNAQVQPQSKTAAIAGFNSFLTSTITNQVGQVPFTPSAEFYQSWVWQANDPLVHYTIRDLNTINNLNNNKLGAASAQPVTPPDSATFTTLPQLGTVTPRYHPWNYYKNQSGDPGLTDLTFKDPMAVNSDAWDFPTNKLPNVGWLGRTHRGTPWQTVYLKSSPTANLGVWTNWTGDDVIFAFNGLGNPWIPISAGRILGMNLPVAASANQIPDAYYSQPTSDWNIFNVFTVAPNDNATRGRLSINQTNIAAWAAALQGVVVLTNTGPSQYIPYVIDPTVNDAAFQTIWNGINNRRNGSNAVGSVLVPNYPANVFTNLGDILSVPELTVKSPFLNTNSPTVGPNDAAYERIPQQILSLVKVGEARYVIYCYGQSLKPAPHSIVQSAGSTFGICTNYQITGEVETRAVIRVDNRPYPGEPPNAPPPQVITESFNVLPPE